MRSLQADWSAMQMSAQGPRDGLEATVVSVRPLDAGQTAVVLIHALQPRQRKCAI
jgi:hypothetical protein